MKKVTASGGGLFLHLRPSVLRIIFSVSFLLSLIPASRAANRYWVAAVTGNWSSTANWSVASGGAGGASVPGAGDAVFFNSGGPGNCTMDVAVAITSINVNASYTGTIAQGSASFTTSGVASFAGGIFSGGTGDIRFTGVFTLNGASFTSTSGVLELNSNAAFTSGSFAHNNGTLKWNGTSVAGPVMSGISPSFYVFEMVGLGKTYNFTSTGNLAVASALNISGSSYCRINTGVFDVLGDINISNTSPDGGGNATINIDGNGPQAFNGAAAVGQGSLPQLTINKSAGTLSLTGFPSVANNVTYTAGTVDPGTSTFCFTRGTAASYAVNGSIGLNNVAFTSTAALTVNISSTTTVTVNDMTIAGSGNVVLNTGALNVNGNINLTNTASVGGGSATINIVGTGNQTLDGTAIVVNQSRLPIVVINKASGTLTLAGNISFSANLTYLSGTIDPTTSVCYIVKALTITGSFPVYDLTIQTTASSVIVISAGSTVTATHNLDIESGAFNIFLNTGTVAVAGDIIVNNTGTGGGGNGTILINGSGAQNFTTTGVIDQGRVPAVTISKTGGTLTLPSVLTVKGNWTYVSGTVDATTNNSNVVFENNLKITGTHTLNTVTFDGPTNYTFITTAGTVLTVLGDINIIGAGSVTLNTGTINLNGNINLSNTGLIGGGTTVINFISAGNQAINSAMAIDQSTLPAITINKPGGTLTLPALITVKGNWTYTAGTLDVNTNNSTVVFANTQTISGTHSLRNVLLEANANHVYTILTGTLLTVTGTLTTTGTANVTINTPVFGSTVLQAQGDILIHNTGAAGGGTAGIAINGTGAQALSSTSAADQGRLPFILIQKTSGVLTLSGIISESRNWTYSSGVVDATTNNSTVVFGGNNLNITSAGMHFNNASVSANTSTLINGFSVDGNLTISGTGILSAGANAINLGGNWTNTGTAGFTEGTSTVSFTGSGQQVITSPGGENFANVVINNTGAGIQLANNIAIATALTMTQGNIDLNGNGITLGTSAVNKGTLTHTNGTMFNTGSFTRWLSATSIPDASPAGLFPVGTATNYRPMNVSAPATAPTSGGTITLSYTDATSNSYPTIPDGAFTVVVRKDLNWAISTGNGLSGGTYNLMAQGTGFGLIGNVDDLRLTLAGSVVGTAGVNGGTTTNPQINRVGLSLANLNNTFYVGSIDALNSPLPIKLISFTAYLQNDIVKLDWETSSELNNDYFTIQRSGDATNWTDLQQVPGAGTSSTNRSYHVEDPSPLSGISYYRLKQTDYDGGTWVSETREIQRGSATSLSVYPNPASAYIIVKTAATEPMHVVLINSVGQLVYAPVYLNGNLARLNVSAIGSGVYFIKIIHGTTTETKQVVIKR